MAKKPLEEKLKTSPLSMQFRNSSENVSAFVSSDVAVD
jgi:hypothetical protein